MDDSTDQTLTNQSTLEDSVAQDSATSSNDSTIMLSLESMIKSHLSSIARLNDELKKHRGMFEAIFENDETYRKHSEQAKEASKLKSATRAQIMKQPQVAQLSEKIKSTRSEIKQLQEALSDYLNEFHRMSGVNEIESDEGEVLEIVQSARLVKKSANFRN